MGVSLRSLPHLAPLIFEQRDMRADDYGPGGTGGPLWFADRVLAEYLAHAGMVEAHGGHGVAARENCPTGTVLALGCGGVPLSGFVASALGWRVWLTDLEV